jgi:phage/conjugal plasmid C-4 type zinc finger TraR family protein
MEKHADLLDLAQAHTARETEMRIHAIRERRHTGQGTKSCTDCGAPIPESRRDRVPNARRCTPCEARQEARRGPLRSCA